MPTATGKEKKDIPPATPASPSPLTTGNGGESDGRGGGEKSKKKEESEGKEIEKIKGNAEDEEVAKAMNLVPNGNGEVSDNEEDEDDQTAALLKGFADSEDESEGEEETSSEKFKKLSIQINSEPAKKSRVDTPGCIYLGRIPHGFYEEEMKSYFGQFGTLLRLRLSRNKKTGRSKHYAFLEFASDEVAKIVSETMDNYLLFGHILRCKIIKKEQIGDVERLFKGANKKFKKVPWRDITKRQVERKRTREEWEGLTKKEEERRKKKQKQLKDLGIDYDFPMGNAECFGEPEKETHRVLEAF